MNIVWALQAPIFFASANGAGNLFDCRKQQRHKNSKTGNHAPGAAVPQRMYCCILFLLFSTIMQKL